MDRVNYVTTQNKFGLVFMRFFHSRSLFDKINLMPRIILTEITVAKCETICNVKQIERNSRNSFISFHKKATYLF
jgi:hypothetical protein